MVNAILSIQPKYCDLIKSGQKGYEFRRAIFKRPVERVYIYSSSPVKMIVGSFQVGNIIEDTPENLWERCKNRSASTRESLLSYFEGKRVGYAIEILNPTFTEPYDPKQLLPNFIPPQSFCYLPDQKNIPESLTYSRWK